MSARFYHIAFNWDGVPKVKELEEPVFNKALDWARYAANCWIVWSTTDPQGWLTRIKPHMGPGDHVFICELDVTNRQGWLPKWMWGWLKKPRS